MSNVEPQSRRSEPADEPIIAVDLFCGGGGLSTALAEACEELDREVKLIAVNHWTKAIETHQANHPWATHLNAKIESINPPDIVEPGSVDILIAAPECTHFSAARGGKPVNEQARASPMHVLDWVGKLQPDAVLVENVPELESWGPIVDGQPTRDGSKFEAWKSQLEADRYSVHHGTLTASEYGDATSRTRFFVMARRDYKPDFPGATHSASPRPGQKSRRVAADIIDWSDRGESLWLRSRPLVNNTMFRIAVGVREYCHEEVRGFADVIESIEPNDVKAMQESIVPVEDIEQAVSERSEPFLVRGKSLERPDGPGRCGAGAAMVMGQQSGARALDVEESPVPTVATRGAIHSIDASAFVFSAGNEGESLYTLDGDEIEDRLVAPFFIEYYGNSTVASVEEPLPTVTTKDRHALCIPELYPWGLDLRYRMLNVDELAAAQGFPSEYEFCGNKTETVKQIGNAVPVQLGKALVKQLLVPSDQPTFDAYERGEVEVGVEQGGD